MVEFLSNYADVKLVSGAVAAGTSDINTTGVDLANYDGCMWVVAFGTITAGAVTSIKLQQGADNSSDWEDLAGTAQTIADDDDDKVFVVDLQRNGSGDRYVRLVVDRGTQNAEVDSVLAIPYRAAGPIPITSSAEGVERHRDPAEGTA